MTLAELLNSATLPNGVYRFISRARPAPILATITDLGWHAGYIDGWRINDKQTFLEAAGQALAFPSYYGRNWDAFEEMVSDLSWLGLRAHARGVCLLYDASYRLIAAQPDAWQTALAILHSAATLWQREAVPFYVLLRHSRHWNRQLPRLAAPVTER